MYFWMFSQDDTLAVAATKGAFSLLAVFGAIHLIALIIFERHSSLSWQHQLGLVVWSAVCFAFGSWRLRKRASNQSSVSQ